MQTAEPAVCAEEEEQVQWWIWAVVHFALLDCFYFILGVSLKLQSQDPTITF
jgi:hypothetical protein